MQRNTIAANIMFRNFRTNYVKYLRVKKGKS